MGLLLSRPFTVHLGAEYSHESRCPSRFSTPGPVDTYQDGAAFIQDYGFPVITKAAMGGGGRGMRVVREQSDFQTSFKRAVSEAKAAFGD